MNGPLLERIGSALGLYCCLAGWRTALDGTVNYGKPVTYAQIEKRIKQPPPRRTIRSWMATLRQEGFAAIELVRRGGFVRGMRIKIWAPESGAQLPLFAQGAPVEMRQQKPVDKLRVSAADQRQDLAIPCGRILPGSSFLLEEQYRRKIFRADDPRAGYRQTFNQEQKAVRLRREIAIQYELCSGSALSEEGEAKVQLLAQELERTENFLREKRIYEGARRAG